MCLTMNIEIANRLVQMRKDKGFSQEVLAEKLGISRQAVSKWERAESSPDTSNLITLAKLYGVSLDELLDTDQEKFESGEPINETETADSTAQNEEPRPDYVNVGWNGIHVKDGDDEVHVGWKGIHIIEDGKEAVRIGQGYGSSTGEDGKWHDDMRFGVVIDGNDHYSWKMDGVFSLVVFCVYLWIGFEYSLWHPGWLLFLTVPVISSFIQAIKRKNASTFAYPMLIVVGYLYLGFVERIWHPTWIAFFTIPIYYSIVGKIRDRKKRNDF